MERGDNLGNCRAKMGEQGILDNPHNPWPIPWDFTYPPCNVARWVGEKGGIFQRLTGEISACCGNNCRGRLLQAGEGGLDECLARKGKPRLLGLKCAAVHRAIGYWIAGSPTEEEGLKAVVVVVARRGVWYKTLPHIAESRGPVALGTGALRTGSWAGVIAINSIVLSHAGGAST